jgi:hypothetical protein
MKTEIAIDLLIGLTGILVGWQIFQSIYVETKIKKGIKRGLQESIPVAISVALAQQGMSLHHQGKKADAAQLLLNSFAVLGTKVKFKNIRKESETFATLSRNLMRFSKSDVDEALNHVGGMDLADVYIKKDFSIINDNNAKLLEKLFKG